MGITGDQTDAGQAAGDQIGEERVPGAAGLGGGDLQTQHFAATIAVDASGHEHDGVDHPAALSDLHRQRVSCDERERPRLGQGTVAELVDVFVEVGGHAGDLGLRQPVDAQRLDELVHPAGRHPGEVAVRDHRDQSGFGAFAALKQPLREVGPRTQLGDGDIDGADAGVQGPVAVAVALNQPARRGLSPFGAAHQIGVSREEGVDHVLQELAHHVRGCFGQQVAQHVGGVDNMRSGHRG